MDRNTNPIHSHFMIHLPPLRRGVRSRFLDSHCALRRMVPFPPVIVLSVTTMIFNQVCITCDRVTLSKKENDARRQSKFFHMGLIRWLVNSEKLRERSKFLTWNFLTRRQREPGLIRFSESSGCLSIKYFNDLLLLPSISNWYFCFILT